MRNKEDIFFVTRRIVITFFHINMFDNKTI